ncbi:cytochrome c oxidase subunit 2A [Sporosarcina highlanderae]|uniref:Cytochrome c oxidase subunit 2A n=1 Tax=Sporosarcina highlanderae TaxID=3035916 RepID=A0ABT8JNV0_9BACL|nr:cytochrome c oxidase subunit 2A [Sporosarcina highlanderae]MDN4606750.1 cytochrome c oxidase subunit 2A [Sporosarcina highlanderae]
MANKNKKQNQTTPKESEISLKGTFISVMLLGVFILALWFGSYALFLSR